MKSATLGCPRLHLKRAASAIIFLLVFFLCVSSKEAFICLSSYGGRKTISSPQVALKSVGGVSNDAAVKVSLVEWTKKIAFRAKKSKMDEAEVLFHRMISAGVKPDRASYSTIMHGHARSNNIVGCQQWFDKMQGAGISPDLVAYNTLIKAYVDQKKPMMQCSQLFEKMVMAGIKPDALSYTAMLKGFSRANNVEKAEEWFEKMLQSNIKPNRQAYTSIMRAHATAQNAAECKHWYEKMRREGIKPDALAFSILIQVEAKTGNGPACEAWLQEMEAAEVRPTVHVHNAILNALARAGETRLMEGVLGRMERSPPGGGARPNVVSYSTALQGFARRGAVGACRACFARMGAAGVAPNAVTYNTLINAHVVAAAAAAGPGGGGGGGDGGVGEAERWLRKMREAGFEPDAYTCTIMMKGHAAAGDMASCEAWLDRLEAMVAGGGNAPAAAGSVAPTGREGLRHAYNTLLNGHAQLGDAAAAEAALRRMRRAGLRPDQVSLTAPLKAHARSGGGDLRAVRRGFARLRAAAVGAGVPAGGRGPPAGGLGGGGGVHLKAANTVLDAFARAGEARACERFFERLPELGLEPNEISWSIVLKAHARSNDPGAACQAWFAKMAAAGARPSLRAWGVLVDGLARAGDLDAAAAAAEAMAAAGAAGSGGGPDGGPNLVILNTLIRGHARQGDAAGCRRWFAEVLRVGLRPSLQTYNTVLDGLALAGDTEEAERWFGAISAEGGLVPDVVSYATVMKGHAARGDAAACRRWWGAMQAAGVRVNEIAFTTMMEAHARAGEMLEAEAWFDRMQAAGIAPNGVAYGCLITGWKRAGDPKKSAEWREFRQSTKKKKLPSLSSYKSGGSFSRRPALKKQSRRGIGGVVVL